MALKDYNNTNDDNFVSNYSGASQITTQTFTTTAGYTSDLAKILIYLDPTVLGDMTLSIRATSASKPTGADLCTATQAVAGLSTDTAGVWTTFTWDTPVALSPSTMYALVFVVPGGSSASNAVKWRCDASSPAYSGGARVSTIDGGANWTIDTTRDMMFEIYSVAAVPMAVSSGFTGGGSATLLSGQLISMAASSGFTGGGSATMLSHVMTGVVAQSKYLVVAGTDQLWYEDLMAEGTLVELVAARNDIDTNDQLEMFEAFGKVFIVNGTTKKVADFQNSKITTTNVGANPPDRGNILTGGSSGAQMVVDYITTLSGACTIYGYRTTTATFTAAETVTGTDDDGNAISFTGTVEVAPPHWYTWGVYGGSATLYGALPTKSYLGALSSGRCVLSGDPSYPHQCPASAAGNPWDWLTTRTTADRAVTIGTGASGTIGDIVRALIPARDGQLVIGCANSIHILIGNPADGGQMVDVNGIGMFGARSWCFDADGNLYFYGTGGVYRMAKGSAQIENISDVALPDLVDALDADTSTHRITLGYDVKRAGVMICVTLLSDGTSNNYWLDLKTGGFFPDAYSDLHGAYSQFYYNANNPDNRELLVGCMDGHVRVHDDATASDDGVAIDSYVCFGPIPLAEDGRDGAISGVDVTLAGGASGGTASDSNNATVKVFADDVAETVVEQIAANGTPKIAATFTGPGRMTGGKIRRGARGAYAGIRIGNSTLAETWGLEKIQLDGGATGRRKK